MYTLAFLPTPADDSILGVILEMVSVSSERTQGIAAA